MDRQQTRDVLERADDELCLEVVDDGSGFDPTRLESPGLGLASMRERVHHLDGRFDLTSRPGGGTRIRARIPVPPIG